jgi:hypothetical protein
MNAVDSSGWPRVVEACCSASRIRSSGEPDLLRKVIQLAEAEVNGMADFRGED